MTWDRLTTLGQCRNPDGTWNGVATMALITGLSEAEIRWTWDRLSAMLKSGMDKQEALRLVKEQAKEQPWKQPPSAM